MGNTKILGNFGERAAADYLVCAGCKIIARNYRTRRGEIDLIAWDGKTLVFFEVKTRKNAAYGTPASAVNARKQQKIIHTAQCFLQQNAFEEVCCRFDVVEVFARGTCVDEIRWIKNAFEA